MYDDDAFCQADATEQIKILIVENSRTVLIVGAGIGGLAAGVALRRRGWSVRIYERRANALELGFGLLLAPNALAALSELGITETVIGRASPVSRIEIRRLNGSVVRRLSAQLGGPAVVALRRDLYDALLNAVGRDTLRLGREVVAVNDDRERITLRLADGNVDTGDALIGADGVRSIVRKQLHPNEAAPRPSGFSAIRGVAYGVSHYLKGLTGVLYLDSGIEAAATRASSDAVYWYMSLLSDEIPSEAQSVDSILATRLPQLDPTFRGIVVSTKPDEMRYDPLFERDPLLKWGSGRITLLGDAAHPVLPHTGQGAAQALEDAAALGLALPPGADVDEALRRYEAVRIIRTRKFIKLGPRIARVTTTRSLFIQSLRTLAIRWIPDALVSWAAGTAPRDPHRDLRR
jgi:2-polyprenyl-6-methoxyphenol hydroxylase-like FAD-dependent oxidoreductase